ncbi:MAG TPA: ribonucleoside triphosphate reductase [Candidatus Limenecus avicola]|uniref:Ribonucleoside triphosphate reductase n=1 Tax=Candidatus Limenecus avicola TaxID=2840847 RepID=A0A9D1SQR0_9CLOT|nr:ribonucleoside triphosphate reductase [Candidatus Limenecus avicola]
MLVWYVLLRDKEIFMGFSQTNTNPVKDGVVKLTQVSSPVGNPYSSKTAQVKDLFIDKNVKLVDDYLKQLDWQVKENSNMTYSVQGLNNYISSAISKNYWLNKIYTPEIKYAHENGDIHIHDLNLISTYCVGWDLKDLLMEGFTGVDGKIKCAPAKHFRTALGQIVNFLYTMQGEAAGAQAFSNFDTLLAPFVKYDKLEYAQVKQAMQEFVFNLNVPTRTGFQTPFTNITMDMTVPSYYADHPVIIGGELMEDTYKEFQHEMNLINKAYFEIMMQGDCTGKVFTFPIPTYNVTKDFDWDNPELEGLWEMTAKYGIPYFSNFINSDMNPEDARSMCCRLRIDNRELEYRGGGLFGSNPLTGSVGVVTINLPRIGYLAKNEAEFFRMLCRNMELARESLEIKRKVIEDYTDKNLYPYTKFYLRDIKARHGSYWKNHFSTIGLVGMNEACENLTGKNIGTDEGREFALKVMDYMRNMISNFQKETGNNYNLEATPAEGTTYRLARLDKQKFDAIKCANQHEYENGAKPFYTNSTQLPVNYTDDIFELLDKQDELQTKYTGGTVVHIFAGERVYDTKVVKNLVKKVCENYKLPYFTFSPTFSICPEHGYVAGEHFTCPDCGSACEVFSRVVGYISPVNQWNEGKKEEFAMRKTFDSCCCENRGEKCS